RCDRGRTRRRGGSDRGHRTATPQGGAVIGHAASRRALSSTHPRGRTMEPVTPARIMEVGMAFWPAKTLLSAIEVGVFTTLGSRALTASELQSALGLHDRANPDFFDALLALRFLERDGDGPAGRYRSSQETGLFLDRASPAYMGGFLEMANARLYPFW